MVCGANASEESVAKGGVNEHCRLYRAEADSYVFSLSARFKLHELSQVDIY